MSPTCTKTKQTMCRLLKKLRIDRIYVKIFIFGSSNQSDMVIFLFAKWLIWKSIHYEHNLNTNMIFNEITIRIQADQKCMKTEMFTNKWDPYTWILDKKSPI